MEYALGAAFFYAWSVTCARRSSAHHGPDLANLGRLVVAVIVVGLFVAALVADLVGLGVGDFVTDGLGEGTGSRDW